MNIAKDILFSKDDIINSFSFECEKCGYIFYQCDIDWCEITCPICYIPIDNKVHNHPPNSDKCYYGLDADKLAEAILNDD